MGESTTEGPNEGADKVHFELVTPARLLVTEDADMVVVPGGDGDFGVLPGHAPLLSSLRAGVVDLYDGDAIVERSFVRGGFAEVTAERCTVLAEEAVRVAESVLDDAGQRREAARQRLAAAATARTHHGARGRARRVAARALRRVRLPGRSNKVRDCLE